MYWSSKCGLCAFSKGVGGEVCAPLQICSHTYTCHKAGGDKTTPSNGHNDPSHRSRVVSCHIGFGHADDPACPGRLKMHKDQGQTSKLALSVMPDPYPYPLASMHSRFIVCYLSLQPDTHLTSNVFCFSDWRNYCNVVVHVTLTWNDQEGVILCMSINT